MKIHDIQTKPIERLDNVPREQVAGIVKGLRKPLIFTGLKQDLGFLKQLNLDFFGKISQPVPVQRPEPDGVNYFVKYDPMPMSGFVQKIRAGEPLYIGARQIMKNGGIRTDVHGLGELTDAVAVPPWIDRKQIFSCNLWVGAGANRTLLHYDPWDGFLLLAEGEKEFILLPDSDTSKVYQYGPLHYPSLFKGAVLHSRIKPLNVQPEYEERFRTASGWRGILKAGEMIYIPAGFWHYVESTGLNIGVNFFVHFPDKKLSLRDPLRTFWIKDNVTLIPVFAWYRCKGWAGKLYRKFVPRQAEA